MGLTHCISIVSPEKDFVIAETALKRAKKAGADKIFPKNYSKAKAYYNKARNFFKNEKYDDARVYFQKSIALSEKIEISSRYKQKKELE